MEKEREIDWEAEYIGWQKSGLGQREYSEKAQGLMVTLAVSRQDKVHSHGPVNLDVLEKIRLYCILNVGNARIWLCFLAPKLN